MEGEENLPEKKEVAEKATIMAKAHSSIQLRLSNEVLREIVDEMNVASLWKKLEGKYKKKSLTNHLYQKQHLYTLRMTKTTPVKEHVNNFNRIILDLQGVGVKIEEEDQAIILLCSLSNSYENFVDSMLYGRDTLSVGDVKDVLQSKELKRMVSGSIESNSDSGLIVTRDRSKERNGGNKMKSRSKSKSRRPRCYHCKEIGHIRRDCPHRRNSKEKKESYGKVSASIVQESFDECELEGSDVFTVSISSCLDTWVMDNGASYHMTQQTLVSFF